MIVKINQDTIYKILAEHYKVRKDNVCVYKDYHFVLKNGDKVKENFLYAIIDGVKDTEEYPNDEFEKVLYE